MTDYTHTPLATWSLERQANLLEEITADPSPTIQRRLGRLVSGSLSQVQIGAQAQKDLAHTGSSESVRCKATRW